MPPTRTTLAADVPSGPRATYRLQLNRQFPLREAAAVTPYLAALGISHLYSSPLLASRAGSMHGYDVVDPTRLDPEVGTDAELALLRQSLSRHGMAVLLDIVPNHLAAGIENPAWEDLLTHGRSSRYAHWFDVDWDAPGGTRGHLVLPVLGDRLSRCLTRGEIALVCEDGRLRVRYGDQRFPLEPRSVAAILDAVPLEAAFADVIAQLRHVPGWRARDPDRAAFRRRESAHALHRLAERYRSSPVIRTLLDGRLKAMSERVLLEPILRRQPYRLVHWRRSARYVNYRRFFEVNDLAGIRVEFPTVFAATHELVLRWIADGTVSGLRIDHVDGLADPAAYLEALRDGVAEARAANRRGPFPIYVEKILLGTEELPRAWPIAGTTGYEFANVAESIFIDPAGYGAIETSYRERVFRRFPDYRSTLADAKRHVLDGPLRADVGRVARLLARIAARVLPPRAVSLAALRSAIAEIVVALPRYRTYRNARAALPDAGDRDLLERAVGDALRAGRAPETAVGFVHDILVGSLEDPELLEAVQRFQQLSGPTMAKGAEDTAFYRWVPLASRNEVGAEPDAPLAEAVEAFHRFNRGRAEQWPRTLSCTSTHDTKRSADVRARLDVLSERPADWLAAVERWHRLNRGHRGRVGSSHAPDRNTEYLLYQTLVGIWPLPDPDVGAVAALPAPPTLDAVRERLAAYAVKAAREAKLRTSWTEPDAAFEGALNRFVDALFGSATFLADVARFAATIVRPGLWNALARTLLHLTAPGVPDLYQGDEVWNFTLVDPDNRQGVDFETRRRHLAELERFEGSRLELATRLAARPEDPRCKLHVVRTALAARQRHAALRDGSYVPLRVSGAGARRIVGFARTAARSVAVTVVPRLVADLVPNGEAPLGAAWTDTTVELPAGQYQNVPTGEPVHVRDAAGVRVAELLSHFPVALLVAGNAQCG